MSEVSEWMSSGTVAFQRFGMFLALIEIFVSIHDNLWYSPITGQYNHESLHKSK